jgi:hypothetical protein
MALLSGVSLVSYFAHIKTQTIRLANGTELSFVTMSHGPTNLCFPGSILDKLIYRFGPAKGIRIGRFNIGEASRVQDAESNDRLLPALEADGYAGDADKR